MTTLQEYKTEDGGKGLMFFCPGCKYYHSFIVERTTPGPCWTWNGDMQKPTFSPSLGINMRSEEHRCHSFVRDGRIEYLSDCWHELRGQAVSMESVE